MRPDGLVDAGSTARSGSVMPCARHRPPSRPERLVGEVRAPRAGLGAGDERDARRRRRTRWPARRARSWSSPDDVERDRRALVDAAGARVAAPSAARPGSTTRNSRRSREPARRRAAASSRSRTAGDRAGRRASRRVTSAAMVAGPHTPSGVEPAFALELPQRGLGLGAEDAVLAAGVEAERVEPRCSSPTSSPRSIGGAR